MHNLKFKKAKKKQNLFKTVRYEHFLSNNSVVDESLSQMNGNFHFFFYYFNVHVIINVVVSKRNKLRGGSEVY